MIFVKKIMILEYQNFLEKQKSSMQRQNIFWVRLHFIMQATLDFHSSSFT